MSFSKFPLENCKNNQISRYLGLTDRKRKMEQRAGLLIVQRNVRSWCTLRTWEWFKLFGKVKPMLKAGKEAEEMEKVQPASRRGVNNRMVSDEREDERYPR